MFVFSPQIVIIIITSMTFLSCIDSPNRIETVNESFLWGTWESKREFVFSFKDSHIHAESKILFSFNREGEFSVFETFKQTDQYESLFKPGNIITNYEGVYNWNEEGVIEIYRKKGKVLDYNTLSYLVMEPKIFTFFFIWFENEEIAQFGNILYQKISD